MFNRIDIRAQRVARNAGRGLDAQDIFGGEWFAEADPVVNCRLALTDQTTERGLRTGVSDRVPQCMCHIHGRRHNGKPLCSQTVKRSPQLTARR